MEAVTATKALLLGGMLFLFVAAESADDPVVAEWGRQRITLEEFRIGYIDMLRNPKVFDSPKTTSGIPKRSARW